MKTLPWVAAEMALHVLAYNLTRVMNGRPTAPGGDKGIVALDMWPSAIAEPPHTSAIRISNTHGQKSRQIRPV